ncbi:MAG: hypothetical protein LBU32_28925 [Clostridiales bacterium]|nr:hypothetical protein [Clostridiales bacterium]
MKTKKLMDFIEQKDDSIIVETDIHTEKIKPVQRPWIKLPPLPPTA